MFILFPIKHSNDIIVHNHFIYLIELQLTHSFFLLFFKHYFYYFIQKTTIAQAIIEESMKNFEEAIRLDPSNLDAQLGKVYVLGLLEKFEEAKTILESLKQSTTLENELASIQEMLNSLNEMKEQQIQQQQSPQTQTQQQVPQTGPGSKEEIEIKSTQPVPPQPRIPKFQPKYPAGDLKLLIENKMMTERFHDVLQIIFEFFDKDRDECWNPSELSAFFVAVNGTPPSKEDVWFIRKNCKTTKRGYLTFEGFLELQLAQAAGGVQETWNDLKKLGFDNSLQPIDDRYEENGKVQVKVKVEEKKEGNENENANVKDENVKDENENANVKDENVKSNETVQQEGEQQSKPQNTQQQQQQQAKPKQQSNNNNSKQQNKNRNNNNNNKRK